MLEAFAAADCISDPILLWNRFKLSERFKVYAIDGSAEDYFLSKEKFVSRAASRLPL